MGGGVKIFSVFLLLSIVRALVELVMLCGAGLLLLHLLAGKARTTNPIYALFALITRLWRVLLAKILRVKEDSLRVILAMEIVLLGMWLGLGVMKSKIYLQTL